VDKRKNVHRKGHSQPDRDPGQDDEPASRAGPAHEQRIEQLFQEHNRSLVRFLASRLHSQEEAREIAQEAYVRLLRLDEPDTIGYLRSYLFRIAANLAIDRLKQRERRGQLRNLVFFDTDASSPPPEKGLDAVEELAVIRLAIEELPPNCRAAFLMHKVHELSIDETAERMQLSIRMVRLYVARALAHCRERLEAAEHPARSKA
jgi:RNA polymerase sigma-70 factor (ECF subfamily)